MLGPEIDRYNIASLLLAIKPLCGLPVYTGKGAGAGIVGL